MFILKLFYIHLMIDANNCFLGLRYIKALQDRDCSINSIPLLAALFQAPVSIPGQYPINKAMIIFNTPRI